MICVVCQSLRIKAFELNLVSFKSNNEIIETFLLFFFFLNKGHWDSDWQLLWLSCQPFVPVIKSKESDVWSDGVILMQTEIRLNLVRASFVISGLISSIRVLAGDRWWHFPDSYHAACLLRENHYLWGVSSSRRTWWFFSVSSGRQPDLTKQWMLLLIRWKISRQRRQHRVIIHICPLCAGGHLQLSA